MVKKTRKFFHFGSADQFLKCVGSEDGGLSVHMDDPVLSAKIAEAGKMLNLKEHKVGDSSDPAKIYACCDLEGHVGKDKRYYLLGNFLLARFDLIPTFFLDFARTAPPEPPKERASYLYNLLRMEFVQNYSRPLSPDAFSNFGLIDAEIHNEEVRQAHQYLLNTGETNSLFFGIECYCLL